MTLLMLNDINNDPSRVDFFYTTLDDNAEYGFNIAEVWIKVIFL